VINLCLFCGGNASAPDHPDRCDGRQGHVEASLYGPHGDVPFEAGSDTSYQAAQALAKEDLNRLEALVFHTIATQPRTCDEVEAMTGLAHQTASARIRGLVLRDQITDSGRRARTRHGRMAVVWRIRTADDRAVNE
jgi:hypothetical protein